MIERRERMRSLQISRLAEDVGFGVRVGGLIRDMLEDAELRTQLNQLFEDHGLILFEDVEPSSRMHVAISNVFGPLKEHPVPLVRRVDDDSMPGVIDMLYDPAKAYIVEIDGKRLSAWLPWHFD